MTGQRPVLYILSADGWYYVCWSNDPEPLTNGMTFDDAIAWLRRMRRIYAMARRRGVTQCSALV